ncbi:MAG: TonB-dependent receptor, partial [Bacteroidota bacterium]
GNKGNKADISINSSVRFDNPLRLPDFQNEFAQGQTGKFRATNDLDGWGPRIEGQTVTDFRGEEVSLQAFPNNVADFYETGATLINNVALGGGNEISDFRLSLTALNQTGIFPGSTLDRYTSSFTSGMKFAQNVSSRFGINYVRTTSGGRVAQGANDPNVLSSLINGLPRNIDIATLQPWIREGTTGGEQLNPLDEMTNNPYWIAFENQFNTEVDRLYGNFEIKYEPVLWFDLTARLGYDNVVDDRFRSNRKGTVGRILGDFTEDKIQQRQLDLNVLATANRDLSEDLFLRAIVGYNFNQRTFERGTVFGDQLTVDQLFSFGNVDVSNPSNDFSERRLMGVFGDVTLTYKEWLSLNLTGRNDWSSTLPLDLNSYFYPSASASFIFTDAFKMESGILSYGKLRASYAEVGSDTGPYQLDFTFAPQTGAFGQFGTGTTFPFNGSLAFSGPGTIPGGQTLRPERTTSIEFGTELQFFKGRFGVDFTYYDTKTEDQILAVPIPESTGYNFQITNVGQVTNQGIEVEVNADILSTTDFNWNTLLTFTKNDFLVDDLGEGVDRLVVNSGFNSIQVVAEPGQPFGLYGNKFRRASSDSTAIIVDPTTG